MQGVAKIANQIISFQYLDKLEQFSANLEKGDLGLNQNIENGFVLYGFTKTGKTAASHIMAGNPLQGHKRNGDFLVQAVTERNKKALIGNKNTTQSQTVIPNFFQVTLKNKKYANKKIFIVDTPGYGDSKGILVVLSNAYYHYRLYSKIQNMKFIICVERNNLNNTAQKFIDTIKQFTSYFKNYQENKEQIWKSCVFLITKVQDSDSPVKDLEQKLLNLATNLRTQLMNDEENSLKEFIRFIVRQQRIFVIMQAKAGEPTQCKDLLQKIDQKIEKWYSRNIIDGKIDMTPISFSIAKQIIIETTSLEKSKQQYSELVKYYNLKIRLLFQKVRGQFLEGNTKNSLDYVLCKLVQDAMGSPQSHQFLDLMKDFVDTNYPKFSIQYKQQRQKRQAEIFQTKNQQVKVSSPIENHSSTFKKRNSQSYTAKKFQALENISKYKNQIYQKNFSNRDIKSIQICQLHIYNIIKQFNRISFKRSKSPEIIYKYGYMIHRIIEQSKVLIMLIQLSANQKQRNAITSEFGNFDLCRLMKDFMAVQFFYKGKNVESIEFLKNNFIKDFDIDGEIMQKLTINQSLVNFFSIEVKAEDHELAKKIIKLILRYSDQILDESSETIAVKEQQKHRLIQRLTISRINCQNVYQKSQNSDQKTEFVMILIRITKNLAQILELTNKNQLSRQVYDSINSVDSICRIYEKDIKAKPKDINLRIEYAKYMSEHFRENDALKLLQQTYQISLSKEDLKRVKVLLSDIRIRQRLLDKSPVNEYEQFLYNQEYFKYFKEQLKQKLLNCQ